MKTRFTLVLVILTASNQVFGLTINRNFAGGTTPSDAVGRFDLLSVAMHEIGHALGVIDFPTASPDPTITTAPRPNPGATVFTTTDGGEFDLGDLKAQNELFAGLLALAPVNEGRVQELAPDCHHDNNGISVWNVDSLDGARCNNRANRRRGALGTLQWMLT